MFRRLVLISPSLLEQCDLHTASRARSVSRKLGKSLRYICAHLNQFQLVFVAIPCSAFVYSCIWHCLCHCLDWSCPPGRPSRLLATKLGILFPKKLYFYCLCVFWKPFEVAVFGNHRTLIAALEEVATWSEPTFTIIFFVSISHKLLLSLSVKSSLIPWSATHTMHFLYASHLITVHVHVRLAINCGLETGSDLTATSTAERVAGLRHVVYVFHVAWLKCRFTANKDLIKCNMHRAS